MSNFDRKKSKIVKKDEMRTKEISKMISEGGLGSENYYNIEKDRNKKDADSKNKE